MIRFACLSLLTSFAFGQQTSIVLEEGDTVPGLGTVTRIDGVRVADDGSTLIDIDTDHPNTDSDQVLLRDGNIVLREGQMLLGAPNIRLRDFGGGSSITRSGYDAFPGGPLVSVLTLRGQVTVFDFSGVFLDDQLVVRAQDPVLIQGVFGGWVFRRFDSVKFGRTPDTIFVGTGIGPPTTTTSLARLLVRLDRDPASGGWSQSAAIVDPAGDAVLNTSTLATNYARSAAGKLLYMESMPFGLDVLFLDREPLFTDGSPGPLPGSVWTVNPQGRVDLNASGTWVFQTDFRNPDFSRTLVVLRDGDVFRSVGDTLAAIAPFSIEGFGDDVRPFVTDLGDVVWFGRWSNPDVTRDEGLFIDDELVLEEGITRVEGATIVDLYDTRRRQHVSPSGNHIILHCEVSGPAVGTERNAVVLIERGVGSAFCSGLPNSTGKTGRLVATGSATASDNDLRLLASMLPPGQFGMFLASPQAANVPLGMGALCLGAPIGEFNRLDQVRQVTEGGTLALELDLTAIPTPTTFRAISAGDTYRFQAWHRDRVGSSNLSSGLLVSFD